MPATAPIQHELQKNGVAIVRTKTGIAVGLQYSPRHPWFHDVLVIEVYHEGRRIKTDHICAKVTPAWRDYYKDLDMLRCVIRVKRGEIIVAELGYPDAPLPFMVLQGEQHHITEAYVSVPPALTITDEGGNVFTLGFERAPFEKSPRGEFAFSVLKNGVDMGEVASRIERRAGKVRAFTKQGWVTWNGRFWF